MNRPRPSATRAGRSRAGRPGADRRRPRSDRRRPRERAPRAGLRPALGALLVAAVSLVLALGPGPGPGTGALAAPPPAPAAAPGVDARAWMAAVPGETPLASLSLPGTHDTMTYAGGFIWWVTSIYSQTQSRDLRAQLDAGVRYLDIRVTNDGGLAHGWVALDGTLDGVLSEVGDFLGANPSEFLVLRLRDEQRSDAARFGAAVAPVVERHAARAVVPASASVPLGEVRGRVLILDDTAGALEGARPGLPVQPYGGGHQIIQDDFSRPAVDDKWRQVRALLHAADSERLRLNHVSATAPLCPPGCYAAALNPRVSAELSGPALPGGAGILALDYPSDEVLAAIIGQNPGLRASPPAR